MKKFVRYLYAYQNRKRIRNVGFVRCETGSQKASLQIYGKGFPVNGNDIYELFVFYLEEEKCIGVSMGTLKSVSPVFAYRLEYDVDDVGGQDYFDRIEGIILVKGQGSEKSWYAAEWNEKALDIEQMIRKENIFETVESVSIDEVTSEAETVLEEEMSENTDDVLEVVEEEEICVAEAVREEEQDKEQVEDLEDRDVIHKITREDLAKLPRCEWKLANNHFLLHGYHNYHHLVSFEKEGAYWLGVPGIYHPDEHRAAKAFGFEQFMRPDEGEIELSSEQKEEDEEFGYWCRMVSSIVEG